MRLGMFSFNPQREGYKRETLGLNPLTKPLFQSPKGRLQTVLSQQATVIVPSFQSPKGRLQTVLEFNDYLQVNQFQSPKGRLQTLHYVSPFPLYLPVSIPKGKATNMILLTTLNKTCSCFNPQREGYKPVYVGC